MSWVEKLDSGRFRAVYRSPEGQRFSKTFDRKSVAKTWLAAADADQARGQWVDPRGGAMLFADWASLWLAGRTVRPSTMASDQARFENHLRPAFGAVPLKDITPMRVRTFTAVLAGRRAPGATWRPRTRQVASCGSGQNAPRNLRSSTTGTTTSRHRGQSPEWVAEAEGQV